MKTTAADDNPQREMELLGHVMAQLSDVTHRSLERELAQFQLTLPQYAALVVLSRQTVGCTMSALAEATYQVSATITGIVDRLEERNLVERRRDQDDRRVWRVFLTDAGKDLLMAVERHRQSRWLHIWSQFEPEERRHMLRLMQRYLEITETSSDQES